MVTLASNKALTVVFIYIGTLCYTIASYLHVSLHDWTFLKAFLIALPVVIVEYQFSLRANRAAVAFHGMSILQVLVFTLCFYFVNLWLLNWLVMKHRVIYWRESACFLLVLAAFYISTNF